MRAPAAVRPRAGGSSTGSWRRCTLATRTPTAVLCIHMVYSAVPTMVGAAGGIVRGWGRGAAFAGSCLGLERPDLTDGSTSRASNVCSARAFRVSVQPWNQISPEFGQGGLARQSRRMSTTTSMSAAKKGLGDLDFSRRLSIAPMMEYTDRFDRYFLRLFSKHALLYTEMVTCAALIHGDVDRHLNFDETEHPIALQLGGSDPEALAKCAKIGVEYGYDEINLNVGCPSDRVKDGAFGACLMAKPELVAECVAAMKGAVSVPVTVKHRIGIDDMDSYENLCNFIETVKGGGCEHFIVHARKAVLGGLTPKQNREIPPLRYNVVHDLMGEFPGTHFSINGGIVTLDQAVEQLDKVDGVMIGRAAYHEPWNVLSRVDGEIFGDASSQRKNRQEIVELMVPFIEREMAKGVPLKVITRHMLGLFHGCSGGRQFRRHISDHAHKKYAGVHTLLEAVDKVPLDVRLGLVGDNPVRDNFVNGQFSIPEASEVSQEAAI